MLAMLALACGLASATVLFQENFEGTLYNDITSLGWTCVESSAFVSDLAVDSGFSMEKGADAVNELIYTKALSSTYTVGTFDKITLTGTFAVPINGYVGLRMRNTSASRWGIDILRTLAGDEYAVRAINSQWTTKPAGTFPNLIDVKMELSGVDAVFNYRQHGTETWNWLGILHDLPTNIADVQVYFYDYSPDTAGIGIDSIKLEAISTGDITCTVAFDAVAEGFDAKKINVQQVLSQGATVLKDEWHFLPEDGTGKVTYTGLNVGEYQVSMKAHGWLRMTKSATVAAGEIADLGEFLLKNGDVDGDNEVTTSDLSVVIMNLREMGDPYPGE